MQPNELFRLVSLRKSTVKDDGSSERPAPDPRLRYGEQIAAQAHVEVSKRSARLTKLRARHQQVSQLVSDLESIQRAVIKTAMLETQKKGASAAKKSESTESSTRRAAPAATPSIDEDGLARSLIIDERLGREIANSLPDRQATLFKETMARVGRDGVADLSDIMNGLDVYAFLDEANKICEQVQAVEEQLSADLPTVAAGTQEGGPIVAAVGWGDLIVARETLVGYTAREIAHIENILPGETKLREHQRVSKTEQVEEREVITERETEKDSQTTDRYELQAQSQETIQRDFSVNAGVNTSAKYGVAQVNASLDTAFAQSQSQSRSTAIETAREIVKKSVERTYERVRTLRRLTLTEEIKELNRHKLSNVGSPPLAAISGMYLWVEKIQRVELRHYGTRMMVEFHIPEPAVSLLESSAGKAKRRRLPPFNVGPSDVDGTNYLCLAQRYGALDVEPPPPLFAHVGFGWVSTLNEEAENWAEDQFTDTINVPAGYTPEWARVAWSGLLGKQENRSFNFAFSVGGVSEPPATKEHTVPTWNGVVLQLPSGTTWPQGVPVAGRVHGSWDGAMYVQVTLTCRRTAEAYDKWRIATWGALRAGYEALARQLAQEEQANAFESQAFGPALSEGPAEINRSVERAELQKWAIKSLRLVPQNFNAIEQVAEHQEMSPVHADAEAPIVRFYENAFEWEHMNYFLYSYHWARRATWAMRNETSRVDPRFEAFLRAGAARLIVPVTPGYEDRVMSFLDPEAEGNELSRILAQPRDTVPQPADSPFRDIWLELLTQYKPDLSRGSGTLAVTKDSADASINDDSQWRASDRDMGRELYIDGERYVVGDVLSETEIRLDRPYAGATSSTAIYAAGSVAYGPPWIVNVPTTLIVLSDNLAQLRGIS